MIGRALRIVCSPRGAVGYPAYENRSMHNAQPKIILEGVYKARFVEPKSSSSIRAINLPRTLLEELRTHKARQSENRLLVGEAYQDHDLIFCTSVGAPRDRGNVLKR